MSQTDEINSLRSLVSPDEIIAQGTPQYDVESLTWNAEKIEKPRLLLRPNSLDHLSKIIAFLGKSNLDPAVRSLGFGNASAKDVLVSLQDFDDFEWDADKKIAIVGAGQSWIDVYQKVEKVTSDYAGMASLSHITSPLPNKLTSPSHRMSHSINRRRREYSSGRIFLALS